MTDRELLLHGLHIDFKVILAYLKTYFISKINSHVIIASTATNVVNTIYYELRMVRLIFRLNKMFEIPDLCQNDHNKLNLTWVYLQIIFI